MFARTYRSAFVAAPSDSRTSIDRPVPSAAESGAAAGRL